MSPSLREIRMFVAVYEERSFTQAADREHATQSGVSQHVHNIEERMGVQLFSRQKGVRPTPAGEAYYRRCIEVLKALTRAGRTLDEFAPGLAGELVVGLMPTMTRSQLSIAFMRFNAQHPNVAVRIIEAYSGVLTGRVSAGELDFAIVPRNLQVVIGIKTSPFVATPEFMVSCLDSGWTHGTAVRAEDLQGMKLVVPGPANVRRATIERYLSDNDVQIGRKVEFDSMFATLDLVTRSDWKAILPGILIAEEIARPARRFNVHLLVQPALQLELMLIEPQRQMMSAAASAFLETLRQVTQEQTPLPTSPI